MAARTARASAVLAGALAVAGCASAAAPAAAPELSGELTQYRRDQPLRQVQVTLTNRGGTDVHVDALRLEAPGFAPQADTAKQSRLWPGRRVDLPVPHGDVDCDADVPAGRTDGTAVARVRVGDGPSREVRVPLSADGGVLALVRRRECAQQALDRAVALSFDDAWPEEVLDGRPVLRPTLVLTRRSGTERVVVQEAGGHVLFSVGVRGDTAPPLLELAGDAPTARVQLDVVTSRCDGHALAESKRTPLFLFYVGVGDAEPRVLAVSAPASVHARLAEFATRSCRG